MASRNALETEARTNLRRRLHELRQLLPQPDQFLQVESRTLQWIGTAPYSFDVADFEASIAQAQQAQSSHKLTLAQRAWMQAADLYQADSRAVIAVGL